MACQKKLYILLKEMYLKMSGKWRPFYLGLICKCSYAVSSGEQNLTTFSCRDVYKTPHIRLNTCELIFQYNRYLQQNMLSNK